MKSALQWIKWLSMFLLGLVLLVLVVVYGLANRSIPDYDAEISAAGIDAELQVIRDNSGVPHIFSTEDSSVFFGLGYAHAQDRLWQMNILRRTAQGRLSELFGERTVKADEFLRRLGLYRQAKSSVTAQDSRTREALEAYARGVNARLAQVTTGFASTAAPEFLIFPSEFEPWQPADSIAIMKIMALRLSPHLSKEVLRTRVAATLPPDRMFDIIEGEPISHAVALASPPAPASETRMAMAESEFLESISDPFAMGASNSWAAMPKRTASGGSLFANDPHLWFSAPVIWYLARLELESGGVIGATIPGVPAVFIGRKSNLGWGLTYSYLDDQDLYYEKLDPSGTGQYLTPDGYKGFRTERETINVKDSDPVSLVLRWTDNGPVIPGDFYGLGGITPEGHVMSLAWTLFDHADTSITAAIRLMSSSSVDGALRAMRYVRAPSNILTVADTENIAMQLIGAMPRRARDHQTKGLFPSPGWVRQNLWDGTFSFSENWRVKNPEAGVLGHANNKITDEGFPHHVTYDWGDTQRIERLKILLQKREVHTRESFVEAQTDTVSFTAKTLVPLVAKDLWHLDEQAPENTPGHRRKTALSLLSKWTGEMNEHIPAPLIYAAWMRELQRKLIKDDLGDDLAGEFERLRPVFLEKVFRDMDGASAWCDIKRSSKKETCPEIAQMALDDAIIFLTGKYGKNIENWRWGDAHQAFHKHETLGGVMPFSWLVNIYQSTSGGDHTLMRGQTSGEGDSPFTHTSGAGYRGVYDLNDPDSSFFIISTGQSGHPLSKFYDNLGVLWRRGEYIQMSLDPDLARANSSGVTIITPETLE